MATRDLNGKVIAVVGATVVTMGLLAVPTMLRRAEACSASCLSRSASYRRARRMRRAFSLFCSWLFSS